jgi:polysaccharide biosynthesis/export protein
MVLLVLGSFGFSDPCWGQNLGQNQEQMIPNAVPRQVPSGMADEEAQPLPQQILPQRDRVPSDRQLPTAPVEYQLGAGDKVVVNVLGYEEFLGEHTVLSDGTINIPLLGAVTVMGMTTGQVSTDLANRLQSYLIDPTVTVSLTTLRAVSVNVAGEVLRPGRVQLQSLSDDSAPNPEERTPPTLSAALDRAGGITQYADIRQVVVKRTNPDRTTQEMTVNLWDAIGSADAPPEMILQDGDAIYIPRLASGQALNPRLLSRSSFAPDTVRVRVVGEVKEPGEVAVPPDSSVSSAVAIAGGPTQQARMGKVAFVRMTEAGEIQREILDLSNLTDNYQIQEGDVIIVPRRGTDSLLDAAGRIFSPLGVILNLFN